MATAKKPEVTADEGLTVTSNDGLQIVDNTDAVEVEVVAVQTEVVELMDGITQVNYL
jgi:hypothetical protein